MTASRKSWKMSSCLRMAILGAKYWLFVIHMQMRCWPCDDDTQSVCTYMYVYTYIYTYIYTHTHTYIHTQVSLHPTTHTSGWVPLEHLSIDRWLVRPALKDIHEQGHHQIIVPVRRANFHHACIKMKAKLRNQTDILKIGGNQPFPSCLQRPLVLFTPYEAGNDSWPPWSHQSALIQFIRTTNDSWHWHAGHIAEIPGGWQPSHTGQSVVDENLHQICIHLHSMSEILLISNRRDEWRESKKGLLEEMTELGEGPKSPP